MEVSRRDFIATAAVTAAGLTQAGSQTSALEQDARQAQKNIIVCSKNGLPYLDRGYAVLQKGGDTLDAVIEVIRGPEDDPEDDSVGLGGLPNEDGVVELDACCMHGPTRMAGAVGAVPDIRNVSLLAKAVMEHTGHVMLVGEGARRFAIVRGFQPENLLTERSRKVWMLWKETHSQRDWWGPGPSNPKLKVPESPTTQNLQDKAKKLEELAHQIGIDPEFTERAVRRVLFPPMGTINCSSLNAKGEISGATTTSGLAWKIPGRLGDSPIIGAGCYCDQDVGSAGATGNGEEAIRIAGAHTVVENMRHGLSPQEAGLDALKRIARNYNGDMSRLRYVSMKFYILRKDGVFAGVSLWSHTGKDRSQFAVHDGKARLVNCAHLFEGRPLSWPPEA